MFALVERAEMRLFHRSSQFIAFQRISRRQYQPLGAVLAELVSFVVVQYSGRPLYPAGGVFKSRAGFGFATNLNGVGSISNTLTAT